MTTRPVPEPARAGAPTRVLMVAIGGYGYYYLRTLLDDVPRHLAVLAGVVDPWARSSRAWREVEALAVPVADTVDAFFDAGGMADLAVVASPIHAHVPQAIAALAHGCAVLVDKPLGATVQEARALAAARDRARRPVLVGYQWSYSAAIRALKQDLVAGVFGHPRRLVTYCAWPRSEAYYGRNTWAGRLRDPATGAWILDGPANNAMAHFLHNALFLLGGSASASGAPVAVTGEQYRAHAIESSDTAACRVELAGGRDIVFLASHVTDDEVPPRFRLECDGGVVTGGESSPAITATTLAGDRLDYGDPDATHQFRKLRAAIDAARGTGDSGCGIEAAAAQTLCVNALHDSAGGVAPFPAGLVRRGTDGSVTVDGLADTLDTCYRLGCLPSDLGVPWARAGCRIDTVGYGFFPGGAAPGAAAHGTS